MFERACSQIRNAIYGVIGTSQISVNRINYSNGTAFMIGPGILVTAAHSVHVENNPNQPAHTIFEVIRAPDVGQRMENAELVAEDSVRDIALLRINNPRSNDCVNSEPNIVPIGSNCGSLGFPLAYVTFTQTGKIFHIVERFQGASISAFHTQIDSSGREISYYETDALMYRGSSGCPGFLENANVFGMHNKSIVERPRENRSSSRSPQAGIETRLAISLWVPSMDIITFARENGVAL